MVIISYIIFSVLIAGGVLLSKSRSLTRLLCAAFFAAQAALAVWIPLAHLGMSSARVFMFDGTGALFFALLALVSPVVYYHGLHYLDEETERQKAVYNALLILLCMSAGCVYFSHHIAVNWIFLEATTLCTAGLIYHRRTARSLEATWKYVFVCSVGIAMAYLGVLLLGGISASGGLGYGNLAARVHEANPLFMKLAFLFILVGYSCKMEIFPFYTIGVDANFAAPTPASAIISTVIVNAGFVSVYRVYAVMENSAVFGWVSNVLILAGLFSVLIGAVFIRRTNHYKRLLSYSTVENMGIAAIGLGVGGAGVFAAMLHVTGHTLLKSAMFLQMGQVGKTYGHYRVNRTGGYMGISRTGGVVILLLAVLLMAFPPSPLFISEILIFRQMAMDGNWLLLAVTVILVCTAMYNLGSSMLGLLYRPSGERIRERIGVRGITATLLLLVFVSAFLGIWRPQWIAGWF